MAEGLDQAPHGSRIQCLDVLRGFALLGILMMNIIGFGLVNAAYLNPRLGIESSVDFAFWAATEVLAEGAMRAIFTLLFGAGILLFLGKGDNPDRGRLYFKRMLCLLIFGLFDAYVLLWTGDILVTYALAGCLLYPVRGSAGRSLLIAAAVLTLLLSLYNWGMSAGLTELRSVSEQVAKMSSEGRDVPEGLGERHEAWLDFVRGFDPPADELETELHRRSASYSEAFLWSVAVNNNIYRTTLLPILLPDALVVMLLGMALYRYGILQGRRRALFYRRLATWGFGVGILINGFEVWRATSSGFDLLASFNVLQPTYHIGRIALALGWLGLVIYLHKTFDVGRTLAAVGRLALTNYLMQSLLCLFIFTGAGLGLVGELARWHLYLVVLGVWIFQILASSGWMARYRQGPLEWLWRRVTYGRST